MRVVVYFCVHKSWVLILCAMFTGAALLIFNLTYACMVKDRGLSEEFFRINAFGQRPYFIFSSLFAGSLLAIPLRLALLRFLKNRMSERERLALD